MVQRAQARQLVGRAGDLEGAALVLARGRCVHDDVVALVDACVGPAEAPQRADDHLGVPVAVEDGRRADDAEVDVALIVEDRAATRAAPDEPHSLVMAAAAGVGQAREVGLQPGVLVAAEDDAGGVAVQQQHDGVRRRGLQQVVLDGEVDEGVARAEDVDLRLVGGVGGGVGGEESPSPRWWW